MNMKTSTKSALLCITASLLLPMSGVGIGFTVLEEQNWRYIDGSYVHVPGLGVDYANISASDDLISIESRHTETLTTKARTVIV